MLQVLTGVGGGIFVLLLPGLAWSYVLFYRREITWAERMAFSFALSIAIVPLTLFVTTKLLDFKINLVNSSVILLGLVALALLVMVIRITGVLSHFLMPGQRGFLRKLKRGRH